MKQLNKFKSWATYKLAYVTTQQTNTLDNITDK